MKQSEYKSYDDLPLFLNAEMVSAALGVSPSSGYELMHEPGVPHAPDRQQDGSTKRKVHPVGGDALKGRWWDADVTANDCDGVIFSGAGTETGQRPFGGTDDFREQFYVTVDRILRTEGSFPDEAPETTRFAQGCWCRGQAGNKVKSKSEDGAYAPPFF